MRVLVTGATGFLGTSVVLELSKSATYTEIVCFGLPGSVTVHIEHLEKVRIVLGDVTNKEDVDAAMEGCEVVFHIAGDTSFWRRLYPRQRHVNVTGAETIAKACVQHGVRRLVHTSTVDALGYNPDPEGVADERWSVFNYPFYNYAATKREGAQRALACNGMGGLGVIVLCPGSMLGPYDFTLQFGRLFFDLRDGAVPGYPIGGSSFGHVKEVAKAHVAAATRGRPGETYIVAGENATYRQLFEAIAAKMGGKCPPTMGLPAWALWVYGHLMEIVSWFTGCPPDMNPEQARFMSCIARYDSSKAMAELGYRPARLDGLVADAYAWYQQEGYFDPELRKVSTQ